MSVRKTSIMKIIRDINEFKQQIRVVNLSEEELVEYYVRGENLIEHMRLFEKPYYEQYAIITRIDFNYLQKIVREVKNNNKEKVYSMVINMLDEIEKEYS